MSASLEPSPGSSAYSRSLKFAAVKHAESQSPAAPPAKIVGFDSPFPSESRFPLEGKAALQQNSP